MFFLHDYWILFILFSLQSVNGVQVIVKDEKKFAMLFSPIVLPCHYTTHSTQTAVVQWWYKSFCTDRTRDSFTFPENLGVHVSDVRGTSHLDCSDKSRTVRIVASAHGASVTLAEHYKERDISIINKADLRIGQLQWGDSGVYFCKVVIANDLEGINEDQVELLVQENAVKGDERITRAVGLCKKLVGHFSHTWKGKMALKKAQKEHNLPEHSLITECPTRWGSRQRMIQRVLEQQRAISDVLSADRKSRHLVPSWQDLDVLESINQALQPLQEFTDALSGERYVSVSYVKPVLHLMNTSILAAKEEDSDLTKSIKMKILEYMNTKYDNPATQELLDMTCFMDPRFKANYISSDKVSDIRARVKSEIEATVPQEQSQSIQDHQGMGPSDVTLKKAKKSLGSFFKTSPAPSSMEPLHTVEVELNNYMMSPTIDSEMDPLTWWQVHQVDFPHLSKLARKYLCIPASSSPSERLFSTSGNVVTCQRTCLKPTKVNMLVFLAKNLE